jgi:hypothetical protein
MRRATATLRRWRRIVPPSPPFIKFPPGRRGFSL